MDLAYLSDAFSHMSMRGGYGRHDQAWGATWMPEDAGLTVAERHRRRNRQRKLEQKKQNQACPICVENKRRKLGSYIRQKSQENSAVLVEEEEEEEEEHEQELERHEHADGAAHQTACPDRKGGVTAGPAAAPTLKD